MPFLQNRERVERETRERDQRERLEKETGEKDQRERLARQNNKVDRERAREEIWSYLDIMVQYIHNFLSISTTSLHKLITVYPQLLKYIHNFAKYIYNPKQYIHNLEARP